ncbi:hypothetical protein [Lentzea sp. NEAU-D7]|uniref:hypothetical protein n=1 Tax=Lentzea sp. NEAU-D7 TaxID=2994667 RepID=UPI00224B4087|nr:hypothetical protein [Lentzea sp. NEAU-D7]MCX2953678.1 hypothetical protein [Lentzea sp. NEAU-D7]
MFRKATAAALVLAAVPAVLTMTFLAGTAQADGDTPWGSVTCTDTPWGRSITASDLPLNGDASRGGDTPWG